MSSQESNSIKIEVAGENALIIYFGGDLNYADHAPEISSQVQQASKSLTKALGNVIVDQVMSYASVLLIFDPMRVDQFAVRKVINETLTNSTNNASNATESQPNLVELPVYYSEESGPELSLISKNSGLTIDEVIALHQSLTYRVYAIGFAPGFAFLGQVDERIATPRLSTPRLKVPRGAVGIADRQTAVYPDVSPGGWNLIGLCPTRMFDPDATPHMPVTVGDEVKFKAISKDEFEALGGVVGETL